MKYLKIIILTLLFASSSHSLLAQCKVHRNFKDLVEHINGTHLAIYDVEVTVVSPGRSSGSHRFTAWSDWWTDHNPNKMCEQGINLTRARIYFSDRKHFDKKSFDLQSFKFDIVRNSVEVTLHSWSNAKRTIRNLVRRGNLIYGFSNDGQMIIFSFFKTHAIG